MPIPTVYTCRCLCMCVCVSVCVSVHTCMLAKTSLTPVTAPVYRTLHGPQRHYPVATLSTTRDTIQYFRNSVGMCISPRPTKKPLGPISQNPPEVRCCYLNFCHFSIFAAYFNELLPGDLSLGLHIFCIRLGDGT